MCLSFTTAACPRQRSHSRGWVPRDSWSYCTVSDSRLHQPGRSVPHIYIPQEHGVPIIPAGTVLIFVACYDSQGYGGGIRARLPTFPLTWHDRIQNDTSNISSLPQERVYQAIPINLREMHSPTQSSELLMVLAITVILVSEFQGAHGPILLSDGSGSLQTTASAVYMLKLGKLGQTDRQTDRQTFLSYDMDRVENDASNNASIVACVRCRGYLLTQSLSSNDKGIHSQTHSLVGGIYEVRGRDGLNCYDRPIGNKFNKDYFRHSKVDTGLYTDAQSAWSSHMTTFIFSK
jgi:hypothetical protein